MINHHRTEKWKKYSYNVFSVLTLIPALARIGISYRKDETFRF